MAQPIAKVKLAPGNVGFYDSLTGVRLTKSSPEAIIYSGKNISNIKKAIQEGKISLKEGTLSSCSNQHIYKKENHENKKNDISTNKNKKAVQPKTKAQTQTEIIPIKKVQAIMENKKPVNNNNNKQDESVKKDTTVKEVKDTKDIKEAKTDSSTAKN